MLKAKVHGLELNLSKVLDVDTKTLAIRPERDISTGLALCSVVVKVTSVLAGVCFAIDLCGCSGRVLNWVLCYCFAAELDPSSVNFCSVDFHRVASSGWC